MYSKDLYEQLEALSEVCKMAEGLKILWDCNNGDSGDEIVLKAIVEMTKRVNEINSMIHKSAETILSQY